MHQAPTEVFICALLSVSLLDAKHQVSEVDPAGYGSGARRLRVWPQNRDWNFCAPYYVSPLYSSSTYANLLFGFYKPIFFHGIFCRHQNHDILHNHILNHYIYSCILLSQHNMYIYQYHDS